MEEWSIEEKSMLDEDSIIETRTRRRLRMQSGTDMVVKECHGEVLILCGYGLDIVVGRGDATKCAVRRLVCARARTI